MDELEDYCAVLHPDVAVVTVPKSAAREVADRLIAIGIHGIWNFTNVELDGDAVFENVHFADSLLTLNYRITKKDESPL
jgi:redox-sensing transcriptional repressor